MSKHLNETMIANELKQGSRFFPTATEAPSRVYPPPENQNQPSMTPREQPSHTAYAPSVRTTVRPVQRRTVRHPFEIYEDQLDELRRSKAMRVLEGLPNVSMSEMVREALDDYIRLKKK